MRAFSFLAVLLLANIVACKHPKMDVASYLQLPVQVVVTMPVDYRGQPKQISEANFATMLEASLIQYVRVIESSKDSKKNALRLEISMYKDPYTDISTSEGHSHYGFTRDVITINAAYGDYWDTRLAVNGTIPDNYYNKPRFPQAGATFGRSGKYLPRLVGSVSLTHPDVRKPIYSGNIPTRRILKEMEPMLTKKMSTSALEIAMHQAFASVLAREVFNAKLQADEAISNTSPH